MRILILGGINITPENLYRLKEDLREENHYAEIVLWSELDRKLVKKHKYSYLEYFADRLLDILSNVSYDYIITETIASNILLRVLNNIDEYINVIMISPSYYKTMRGKLRFLSFLRVFYTYSLLYFKAHLSHKYKSRELLSPMVASCLYTEAYNDSYMIVSFSTNHIHLIRGRDDTVISNRNLKLLAESIVITDEYVIDGGYDILRTRYKDTYASILYILSHTWDNY